MRGRLRAAGGVLAGGLLWGLLDQATKFWAVMRLTRLVPDGVGIGARLRLYLSSDGLSGLARAPIQVIPGVWQHVYVENRAGAFGLLSGAPFALRRAIFLGVAALATGGILWMASRSGEQLRPRLLRLGLALVLGGALGNLFDRALHGYVIDFVDWYAGRYHWPVFNVADVGIVVGVFLLLFFSGPRRRDEAVEDPVGAARVDPEGAPGEADGASADPGADPGAQSPRPAPAPTGVIEPRGRGPQPDI